MKWLPSVHLDIVEANLKFFVLGRAFFSVGVNVVSALLIEYRLTGDLAAQNHSIFCRTPNSFAFVIISTPWSFLHDTASAGAVSLESAPRKHDHGTRNSYERALGMTLSNVSQLPKRG